MVSVLASLVVTGIFLIVQVIVGRGLRATAKPYGLVKPSIHITLFVLVLSGVIASIYKLQGLPGGGQYVRIALYVAVLTLFANLVVGATMIIIRSKNQRLVAIHRTSTIVMAISIVAGILSATTAM